ncbi:helix-hairpin-helix domain-containing protein [Faecalicatena contorta]|uniref:helix-hairpin-helix domain-containing protein n=1 Tax=Faecalicatena contorta TaxID=39482 RepID=UPI001F41AFB7|nr:helix-hairpin-helix domain-containing protein [Faecalicatena contorta]MCF2682957.1 helix-hairpin-helix domain-containing protein [Faecalicatena contorta]
MSMIKRLIQYLLFLAILVWVSGCSADIPDQKEELTVIEEEVQQEERPEGEPENQQETICVHVCGEVCNPGVYELEAGSRLYEAIEAAGGMTEKAAKDYLNQAEKAEDGQQIYVPSGEEVSCSDEQSVSGNDREDGKVNLNTASKEQLMTLSGIGEAKASAIISYREAHGGFQNIEELMQVEGIKEGVFQKVKDQIKV